MYGHVAARTVFLDKLEDNKQQLCRAYTQDTFNFNDTSTQRGKGCND